MQVHGTIRTEVQIEPKDVIEKLIDNEVGWRGWVVKRDGKYYRGQEMSAGSHSYDSEHEISKDIYDYVQSLKHVLKTLKEREI